LFTRNGHDWTDRFPFIVEAAHKLRRSQFIVDSEPVVLGVGGISDFEALRSRQPAGPARRLGYINHATGRKGHDRFWPFATVSVVK
jgi:ATP-dependent DNA ligase